MSLTQLFYEQRINTDIDNLWKFISSPKNLSKITPSYMDFKILSKIPDEMYEGLIISYTVKPILGVKMNWVTEITHIKDKKYFVDEQRFGPYSLWHHKHFIKEVNGGIEMEDIIHYKIPLGFIGYMMNYLIIKNKLGHIFEYRRKKLNEIFGELK